MSISAKPVDNLGKKPVDYCRKKGESKTSGISI